jgi:hypothetical protein
MNGEYLLSLDPYNFDTEEEFIKHHYPELLEEKKEFNYGKSFEEICQM